MRKLETKEIERVSVETFKIKKKNPFVLVLDNLRSLHNVGAAFRLCDAFSAEKIFLCGITGTPPHREIDKTALGAAESVDWEYASDTLSLIRRLRKDNYTIIAAEHTDGSTPLHRFPFETDKCYCFVFGNEIFGVNEEVIETADHCVEIPQSGTKHSINVSVSMGIVLWEYIKRLLP